MHSGEAYGAQAVLSAAHQKATGTAVTAYDWSSKDQAARILRELGFRVLAGDDPEAVVPVTGEWRETSEVGPDVTRDAWATAARERLLEAARRYRATVPPQELAIEVQRRSGIRTRQLWHHWIDEVIGRHLPEARARNRPDPHGRPRHPSRRLRRRAARRRHTDPGRRRQLLVLVGLLATQTITVVVFARLVRSGRLLSPGLKDTLPI